MPTKRHIALAALFGAVLSIAALGARGTDAEAAGPKGVDVRALTLAAPVLPEAEPTDI